MLEVVIREVKIRGEREYIIDPSDSLANNIQLSLLMKASYNSLLTNPDIIQQSPELAGCIEDLKSAVERFLRTTANLEN